MDDPEILIKLKKSQIKRAEDKLDVLNDELAELYTKCPHSILIPKDYYCSGNYNDYAYSSYCDECETCYK